MQKRKIAYTTKKVRKKIPVKLEEDFTLNLAVNAENCWHVPGVASPITQSFSTLDGADVQFASRTMRHRVRGSRKIKSLRARGDDVTRLVNGHI